jgi:hypothetical protein
MNRTIQHLLEGLTLINTEWTWFQKSAALRTAQSSWFKLTMIRLFGHDYNVTDTRGRSMTFRKLWGRSYLWRFDI